MASIPSMGFCYLLSEQGMHWIESNLFSCPFKTMTGWDCPGCGFQRSVLALLNGDMEGSLLLYPASVPILLLAVWSLLKYRIVVHRKELISRMLLLSSFAVILASYILKLKGM